MAVGWAPDGAVQKQIDDTVSDNLRFIKNKIPQGESAFFCIECEEPIPEKRRKALPGVKLCIECQEEHDNDKMPTSFNRRANKASQIR